MGQTFTIPGLIKYKRIEEKKRERASSKFQRRKGNKGTNNKTKVVSRDSSNFPRYIYVWLILVFPVIPSWRIFERVVVVVERTGGRRWKGAPDGFRTTEVCGIVSIWLDILESRSTLPQPWQDLEICFLYAPSCGGCSHASDKNITPSKSMVNFFDSG